MTGDGRVMTDESCLLRRIDCTLGDAAYRLYMRQLVEEARQDVREGRVFTQEEVEREAARWLEP